MSFRQTIKSFVPLRLLKTYRRLRDAWHRQREVAQQSWQLAREGSPFPIATRSAKLACLGNGDGQWCVDETRVGSNPVVLSFGIGNDISWDKAMIERFGATVYAFDPTPIALNWLQSQHVPDAMKVIPFGLSDSNGFVDFSLPTTHGVSFVMNHTGPHKTSTACEVRTFSSLIDMLQISKVDVLKLDIEGAEYRVVNDILDAGIPIRQLLIEFHHRFYGAEGIHKTADCIHRIQSKGFELFYRSPRGLEFCFSKEC